MSDRRLWIDTAGAPVITTTQNGIRNARRWGWTEAKAVPIDDAEHEKAVRERIARDIEAAGREDVGWLAAHQDDRLDSARVVGAEDAWKAALRIVREDT